jgi:hypothetical protein
VAAEGALPQVLLWDMVPESRSPVPSQALVRDKVARLAAAKKTGLWCPCTQVPLWALREHGGPSPQHTRRIPGFLVPCSGCAQGLLRRAQGLRRSCAGFAQACSGHTLSMPEHTLSRA